MPEASNRGGRRLSRWSLAGLALLAAPLLGCGCGSQNVGIAPRDAREALERINSNMRKIARPVIGNPATVSFRFKDADGKTRRFLSHPATVLYGPPRCLYFDVRTLAGSVARIGSNDIHYWFWTDTSEQRKLWYGTWAARERGESRAMLVAPDELLDSLLMRPIEPRSSEARPPLLVGSDRNHRLLFQAMDDQGWPYVERELLLDPEPPYLPVQIIDRDSAGRMRMHALLKDYRRIEDAGDDAPFTPRRYIVDWPQDDAELRLDFDGVHFHTSDTPFCEFDPSAWQGELESVDQAPPPAEVGLANPS